MKSIILSIFFLLTAHTSSQNLQILTAYDDYFYTLKNLNFEKATFNLKKLPAHNKKNLNTLLSLIEHNGQKPNKTPISYNINSKFDSIVFLIVNARLKNVNTNTRTESIKLLKKAYTKAVALNYTPLTKRCLLEILNLYKSGLVQTNQLFTKYITDYKLLKRDETDKFWIAYYNYFLLTQFYSYQTHAFENKFFFEKQIKKLKSLKPKLKNHSKLNTLLNTIYASYYLKTDKEKSKKYYTEIIETIEKEPYYFNAIKFKTNLDLARYYALTNNYSLAIKKIKASKKYIHYGKPVVNKLNYHFFLSEYFGKLKHHDSAYFHLKQVYKLENSFNHLKENEQIANLEIKLFTEKKEKENLELKTKNLEIDANRKTNLYYFIIALCLLLFLGITSFLFRKNSLKTHKLIKQEKLIEQQKVSNLLKEQELVSIDAMIEGQEKERQRIANDLHDDLGSLMATIKLHFNALKEKSNSNLLEKTNTLLDEAYTKIRQIAHAKNSGVIANQGLLKAIYSMADKIARLKKIQIDVHEFGFKQRLENSLELTLFRVIQELTTNIIKHAQATHITINLTKHEDLLNIMIEDNGIGFDSKTIHIKKGMGLHSIDKRIAYLEGSFTIDSMPKQGTTIIIELPI